nr:hypothetical protein [Catenibacterium mitsuokai]
MSVRFAPATEPMSAPMTVPGTNPQSTFLFLISLAVYTTVPVDDDSLFVAIAACTGIPANI